MILRELTPELAKIAKEELKEDPRRIENDIDNIKNWIAQQPYLNARTDDQWLTAILRGCKFSLERVKKKIDLFYTLRTTAPDITLGIKPTEPKFVEILRLGAVLVLPKSKTLSPRAIMIRPGAYDPAYHSIADIMCVFYYLALILILEDDAATVVGTKVIVDYQNCNIGHLAQVNPNMMKKLVVLTQDAMPLRLKGNHHVNLPSVIESIFTMLKTSISEKAKQRMQIHKSNEELLVNFPKESVPQEYGGSGGTVREIVAHWEDKIAEFKPWLLQEMKFGTDETRRPGKPQSSDDVFGVEGSFRKLALD